MQEYKEEKGREEDRYAELNECFPIIFVLVLSVRLCREGTNVLMKSIACIRHNSHSPGMAGS